MKRKQNGWMSALEALRLLSDYVIMNLLFVLGTIPVITAGASAAGLFYAVSRRKEQGGSVGRLFWKGFRENFIQASGIWLLYLLSGVVIIIALWFYRRISGVFGGILSVACLLIALVWALSLCWVFYLQTLFSNRIPKTISNAVRLCLAYPLPSAGMTVMLAVPGMLLWVDYDFFLKIGFVWVFFWFSVCAAAAVQLTSPAVERIISNLPNSDESKSGER